MASPNREEMLKMGIRSFKQGNPERFLVGAKMLFRQVLQRRGRTHWRATSAPCSPGGMDGQAVRTSVSSNSHTP